MSGQGSTILIFAAELAPETIVEGTVGSNQVPVDAIKANLKTVMRNVSHLILATREVVGDLHVSHVDVGIAIALDGSVGLVGTGAGAGGDATLKLRLQFSERMNF